MKVILSVVLQLVGGSLFGLGFFGGQHADRLRSTAAIGAWRMRRWFNWKFVAQENQQGVVGNITYQF